MRYDDNDGTEWKAIRTDRGSMLLYNLTVCWSAGGRRFFRRRGETGDGQTLPLLRTPCSARPHSDGAISQADVGEFNNITDQHPDVVASIAQMMEEAHVENPFWKSNHNSSEK